MRQVRLRLEEARTLFSANLYEGCVARAYYAAFTSARAMLAADESFPKTHAGVIHEFGRRYVKTGVVDKAMHQTLARLESKRDLADYGSGEAITRADAVTSVDGAQNLVDAAASYLGATKERS